MFGKYRYFFGTDKICQLKLARYLKDVVAELYRKELLPVVDSKANLNA